MRTAGIALVAVALAGCDGLTGSDKKTARDSTATDTDAESVDDAPETDVDRSDDGVVPDGSGWTCSPTYFGTNDGCDCGCGLLDPDCPLCQRE